MIITVLKPLKIRSSDLGLPAIQADSPCKANGSTTAIQPKLLLIFWELDVYMYRNVRVGVGI